MSIFGIRRIFGASDDSETEETKLRTQIVENFQPSMRVVGTSTLTMDPGEARRTAKIHGQDQAMVTAKDAGSTIG